MTVGNAQTGVHISSHASLSVPFIAKSIPSASATPMIMSVSVTLTQASSFPILRFISFDMVFMKSPKMKRRKAAGAPFLFGILSFFLFYSRKTEICPLAKAYFCFEAVILSYAL